MRPSCRWCWLAGLWLSGLVHVAVGAAILRHYGDESIDAGDEHRVAVSLAMFAAGSEPESASFHADVPSQRDSVPPSDAQTLPKPESKQEPSPALASRPDPRPETQHKPEPESKPKAAPSPESEVEPILKPKPKPRPKIATKSRSEPRSKPKPVAKRRPRPRPHHASKHRAGKQASTAPGGVAGSPAGSSKMSSAQKRALEKKFLAGLRRAIAKKRRYPTSARRVGKTGTATVYFVLDRNGRIRDARLDKSSGSSILDRSAVDTLRRLARYKPIPESLGRSRWPLRVPIRFALE
jgi:protein TonB